jgi:hypothetical protein
MRRRWKLLACVLALAVGSVGCSEDEPATMGNAGTAGDSAGEGGAAGDPAGQGGDQANPMSAAGQGGGGAGGTAGDEPTAGTAAPEPDAGMEPEGIPYAMDECEELNSGFPGDEFCIDPPPAGEGFQLHIGPTDYANPDPMFVLEPDDEATNNFPATSGNDSDIHFLFRQFRMRPGAHHMIVTAGGSVGGGGNEGFGGRRIATANASQDSPVGGIIAPENEGVGIPLAPSSSINVSLHSINVSDMPLIREIWVNFWYRDSAKITEEAEQLFATGDVGFSVAPGADVILGPYSCDISAEGRMLWFYGHRHANNKRFSAWRVRGGQRDLFYEGLHWEETLLLEYTSLITNPVANAAMGVEGGWSGILDLKPGDKLEWECHVVNEQDVTLRFSNNTYTGEMCIMDAELVGTRCTSGFGLPGTD